MVYLVANKSVFVACLCACVRVCVFLPCVHRFEIEGNSGRVNSSNCNGKFSYFPTHRCVSLCMCFAVAFASNFDLRLRLCKRLTGFMCSEDVVLSKTE